MCSNQVWASCRRCVQRLAFTLARLGADCLGCSEPTQIFFGGGGTGRVFWFGVFVTWFFAPLSSDDSDGVNGRLGRWWCIRKLPKNARHCEIPILAPTVKSTVGFWGVGSRELQGATQRVLVFVGIASVCSSLSRGLLIPWPSDTQTLAPLVVPHAHFQSASARACICSCHVESSLPLVALAVPFCVRWTYYHPSSVFILKFSAPLFVASIFSLL